MLFEYYVCGGGCNRESIHGSQGEVGKWLEAQGWVVNGDHHRCPSCKGGGGR